MTDNLTLQSVVSSSLAITQALERSANRSHPTPTLSMCSNKMPRQVLKLEKHNWGDYSLNSPSALQLSDLLSRSPLLQARSVPATWGVKHHALSCLRAFTVVLSLPTVLFLFPRRCWPHWFTDLSDPYLVISSFMKPFWVLTKSRGATPSVGT